MNLNVWEETEIKINAYDLFYLLQHYVDLVKRDMAGDNPHWKPGTWQGYTVMYATAAGHYAGIIIDTYGVDAKIGDSGEEYCGC